MRLSPFVLVAVGLLYALPTTAATFDPLKNLTSESGWSEVGTRESDKAKLKVRILLKEIGGLSCLQGVTQVEVSAETLLTVVTDIPGAKNWSSAPLTYSKVLGRDSSTVDYFQYLDVPGWTLASDRYWVLRGRVVREGSSAAFQWDRFDWRSKYADTASLIASKHEGAIEPPTNYGEWRFMSNSAGTEVRYYVCSDVGGSLPESLQKTAALQTLPDTVADLIAEARRR